MTVEKTAAKAGTKEDCPVIMSRESIRMFNNGTMPSNVVNCGSRRPTYNPTARSFCTPCSARTKSTWCNAKAVLRRSPAIPMSRGSQAPHRALPSCGGNRIDLGHVPWCIANYRRCAHTSTPMTNLRGGLTNAANERTAKPHERAACHAARGGMAACAWSGVQRGEHRL